jgi:hypothetical protein
MTLASWIVATHFRPQLLRACLESLRDQVYPAGWRGEIIVAHHELDTEGAAVAREFGAATVATRAPTGGGKRNAALKAAAGDLVLVADDDDCQSPLRAGRAIAAHQAGHGISELREFRYLHLATGQVVRWCGRGDDGRPPVIVGTARNYRRSLLTRVGGWKPLPRMIEKDIQARITSRLPGKTGRAHDLGTELADSTVCIQHSANVWDDRPVPAKGKKIERGAFLLVGEGHWSEAHRFPAVVAERLGLT